MKKNTGIHEYWNTGIFLIDFHDIVVATATATATATTTGMVVRPPHNICHIIHCIYDVLVDLVVVVIYRQVV